MNFLTELLISDPESYIKELALAYPDFDIPTNAVHQLNGTKPPEEENGDMEPGRVPRRWYMSLVRIPHE